MFWGYGNLARYLGPHQPVLAFRSRALQGEDEHQTIEELAESYLRDLKAVQPHGPYYLGGYCFGGLVAYEMAHRLRANGEDIPFVALINSMPPNSRYTQFCWTPKSAWRFALNVCLKSLYLIPNSTQQWAELLRWKMRVLCRRCRLLVDNDPTSTDPCATGEYYDESGYNETEQRLWQTHLRAILRYRPPVSDLRVALFRSPLHLLYSSFEADYGWSEFAKAKVTIRVIPGTHHTMMEKPSVRQLAKELRSMLVSAHSDP